jgi:hypothetical protein
MHAIFLDSTHQEKLTGILITQIACTVIFLGIFKVADLFQFEITESTAKKMSGPGSDGSGLTRGRLA